MVGLTMEVEELGAYLQRRMRLRGINSAGLLASESGVPEATVRQIVYGRTKRPDLDTLLKLSKALRVPFETLARVAAGLPEYEAELPPEQSELKQRLDAILDRLDPQRQKLAERILRQLLEWGDQGPEGTTPPAG